jgi:membrane protein
MNNISRKYATGFEPENHNSESGMNPPNFFEVIKATFKEWGEDNAARLAAALAYYTTFSLVPTLVIVIALAGLLGRGSAVQDQILFQLENLVGSEGRILIQGMIESAHQPTSGMTATILGTVTLLFGALGVFGELQNSLNTIWDVQPKPLKGLKANLKRLLTRRLLSFTMILGIGFVLLVSLILNAMLAAFQEYISYVLPLPSFVLQIINFVVSFGVITLLFALMFKILPDAHTAWKDVWLGAAVTSLLFGIGKVIIAQYLGTTTVQSTFGAAGSLAVILIWIYYSAQILFFGAEFTQVYANRCGSQIGPDQDAILLNNKPHPNQGIPRLSEEKSRA